MTTETRPHAPPLESGDRLARAEFERRYRKNPEIKKAELIEGVVYVASPVRIARHAQPNLWVDTWLGTYLSRTPGVIGGTNGTVRLDADNEPQPDAFLTWDTAHGGRAHLDEDDYLAGPPDLVVEIAASSAAYDLHDKLEVYRRNGVREYVVWQILEERIDWFSLRSGQYIPNVPDGGGVAHSAVFPGLRLNIPAMLAGNIQAVLSELGQES